MNNNNSKFIDYFLDYNVKKLLFNYNHFQLYMR